MDTRRAGVREAKENLSRLLRDVREGREWVITDRGRPVARLVPIEERELPIGERLRRLEEAGVIEPAGEAQPLPEPLPVPGDLAQRWLREDRDAAPWPCP